MPEGPQSALPAWQAVQERTPPQDNLNPPSDTGHPQEAPVEPEAPKSIDERIKEKILEQMGSRSGGGWAQNAAQLGQLGLGAAGLAAKLFDTGPKKDPLADELKRAQIDKIRADIERTLNPVFPPRSGGGGGGGGPAGPPQPGGAPNVEAFKAAAGLAPNDQRFEGLYNQILQETGSIPKMDEAGIQQRAQELIAMAAQEIESRYAKQEQAIMEKANKLGGNPAAELAAMEQSKQAELGQLMTKARTQALAEGQTQQSMLLNRITPAMEILKQVNPAQYAEIMGRVFGTPTAVGVGAPASGLSGALGG